MKIIIIQKKYVQIHCTTGSFLLAWNVFNSILSVLISSCNFEV